MYTLISGSQKLKKSNSMRFLNIISENIDTYKIYELIKDSYEDIIDSIKISDTIVLAFPLYVDSPPSITLKFLDYIFDNNIDLKNKNLYIVINCGFLEGEQNITGLNIIKNWAEKVNMNYMGSILIGAGEVALKDKYKLISKSVLNKIQEFSTHIKNKSKSEDIITTIDFVSKKLYCTFANRSWVKKAKRNKLPVRDIEIK